MSDVGWGSDHLEPPKRRKVPLWIWGCGGGCMFLIGAILVAAVLLRPRIQRWYDSLDEPAVQWPELAEVLPFDAPPQGVTIERFPFPIFKIWKLDAGDVVAFVFSPPQDQGNETWGEWLTDPKQAPMFANQEGTFECNEGTLTVQGRELRSVRFTRTNLPYEGEPVEPPPTPPPRPGDLGRANASIEGSGLDFVITNDASARVVLVWLVRETRGETVSDEQAAAFLAPFQIGPNR